MCINLLCDLSETINEADNSWFDVTLQVLMIACLVRYIATCKTYGMYGSLYLIVVSKLDPGDVRSCNSCVLLRTLALTLGHLLVVTLATWSLPMTVLDQSFFIKKGILGEEGLQSHRVSTVTRSIQFWFTKRAWSSRNSSTHYSEL